MRSSFVIVKKIYHLLTAAASARNFDLFPLTVVNFISEVHSVHTSGARVRRFPIIYKGLADIYACIIRSDLNTSDIYARSGPERPEHLAVFESLPLFTERLMVRSVKQWSHYDFTRQHRISPIRNTVKRQNRVYIEASNYFNKLNSSSSKRIRFCCRHEFSFSTCLRPIFRYVHPASQRIENSATLCSAISSLFRGCVFSFPLFGENSDTFSSPDVNTLPRWMFVRTTMRRHLFRPRPRAYISLEIFAHDIQQQRVCA